MTVSAPPAPPAVAPGRRRWLWVLLLASLALNAMLAGVMLRGLWGIRDRIVARGGVVDGSLPAFVATLPTERRNELRRAETPERPGALRPLRQEVRRMRAEAARAFVADPFDKQAFMAAQARLFDSEAQLRQALQRMLPELGERMTAAERRAYLHWRRQGFGPGGF